MNWWLVLAGLVIHLIFFYSIFDIYFTSPLVHGMTPHASSLTAPAKRLVLFVADGLRADKTFELDEAGRSRAPFLRNVMERRGAWGVSHTRVPTESRPGHVALIAGFYEDVSAVAKGWKENPVEFDSVFNESQCTWSWGSPDILPMFSKGATGDHVFTHTYPGESEDFAGADLSKLDTWVFDRVKEFLDESRRNETLRSLLQKERVVLFMHLLGLDTNGHANKPYSSDYLNNIGVVDAGVREMEQLMEDFFGHDASTAYVFTSDHGMTNWGSHGAGHPSETLTPLVAWGAGVRAASPATSTNLYKDNFEKEWKTSTRRSDVAQADISPLMASLIGVAYPLNSVGTLPLDYLDNTLEFKAESIFTNAKQILAQFEVKMKHKQETTLSYFFSPYKPLASSSKVNKVRHISNLMAEGKHQEAIADSLELIELALEGLNYYHNYDRFFLGVSITLGFLGWISYIITVVLQSHTTLTKHHVAFEKLELGFWFGEKGVRITFLLVGVTIATLLYVQSLPWPHYLYCLVPVILWHKVIQRRTTFKDLAWYITDHGYLIKTSGLLFLGVAGLEIMVLSFFYRGLLSLGLVGLAVWPLFTPLRHTDSGIAYGWLLSCLTLAVFPLLPVVGRDANYLLVCLAGIIAFVLAVYSSTRPKIGILAVGSNPRSSSDGPVKLLTGLQLLLILVSVATVWIVAQSIAEKQGLPLINQVLNWCILALSVVMPLCCTTRMYPRLISIALSFLSPYLLLSTAQEGLFYVTLCVVMFFWIQVETKLSVRQKVKLDELDFGSAISLGEVQRKLISSDIRCAYVFIFFLLLSFFGTGNIASINSFDPASVLCFVTVFNPFIMGALMMWKNVIPFLLVTCTFNAIHLAVNVPTQSLFLLVLLMSDFMGLQFFFLVKDYGSWLDIGTSISHYVIVMCMILFIMVLLSVTKVLTATRMQPLPLVAKVNKHH